MKQNESANSKRIEPGIRSGEVVLTASKSMAHRLLICAALTQGTTELSCRGISKDIEATIDCLRAMGAEVSIERDGEMKVGTVPTKGVKVGMAISQESENGIELSKTNIKVGTTASNSDGWIDLPCKESGSTLRFLLPVVGALGLKARFYREGRLSKRPMLDLIQNLEKHGIRITEEKEILSCEGKLTPGEFHIPGSVSSQYISGLLFALALTEGESRICVSGELESAQYVQMTIEALQKAGIAVEQKGNEFRVTGGQKYRLKDRLSVEGDWSAAAFFLVMGAFSEKGMTVRGTPFDSSQPDAKITKVLQQFGCRVETLPDALIVKSGELSGSVIDVSQIPDMVPALSVLAAGAKGQSRLINAGRLRLKESDRLLSTTQMICDLGGDAVIENDCILINGSGRLRGGKVNSYHDHRIAMAAAAAACICENAVEIDDSVCTEKSFPGFWAVFHNLRKE